MTSVSLGASYLEKAAIRLKVLELLLREHAYSDVVREAQEVEEAERALADARFVVGRARVVLASVRGDDEPPGG